MEEVYELKRIYDISDAIDELKKTRDKLDLPLSESDKERLGRRILELMEVAYDSGYNHGKGESEK